MSLIQASLSSDSSLSDSDPGYVTPVESFADDEHYSDEKPLTEPVEPELVKRIIAQVEWYFSDENLLKDSFLMKHINRNKLGYVSLKLVASLRKVKALTKDWEIVLASLKQSTALALNDDGTKIRRLSPAPEIDYAHVNRTLLVTNYPIDEPSTEQIEQHFQKHGEVSLVRILHPGRAIPLDVKPSRLHHSQLGKETCILVEFKSQDVARRAAKNFLSQLSWRDDVKVTLLGSRSDMKSPKQLTDGKRKQHKSNSDDLKTSTATQSRWHKDESRSPSPYNFIPSSKPQAWTRNQSRTGPTKPLKKYLAPSDSDSGRASSESPSNSPEPTKKFFSPIWRKTDKSTKENSFIRTPLGPDGTRGFRSVRSKVHISVSSF